MALLHNINIDSSRSLLQHAIEDLNTCMERTARPNELVKRFTAKSFDARSAGSLEECMLSLDLSFEIVGAPQSPTIPSKEARKDKLQLNRC
jgi:hypothetical protein